MQRHNKKEWWKRNDVRRVLQYFYDVLEGAARFSIVGKRFGPLRVIGDHIPDLLDTHFPIEYLGFSVCGWNDPREILESPPTYADIEMDLDNFPFALKDLKKITKWLDQRNIKHLEYFTGSRGVRICIGRTHRGIREISKALGLLAAMENVYSLDLMPYRKGMESWWQPLGNLHRKNSLPSYVIENVPTSFEDFFPTAARILKGKKKISPPDFKLGKDNGDRFIKAVRRRFQNLSEKERENVEDRATHIIRMASQSSYDYPYRSTYYSDRI